ncbi:hypothetical protein [Actinomadura violacea]|uniref:Lipoprotein n=1 Tax=Actinomadura violacea TaxID=2819934 RepID=A0ABS3RLS3_9ACTN|nr:hypothetical protein [Actinomadura violacea]MBO2457298.1 hypothetical protein [Actinomadura violacea]
MAALFVVLIGMTEGCGNSVNHAQPKPKVADPDTIRAQIEKHLTEVSEMASLPKAKTKPPAALINTDVGDTKNGYSLNGVWSAYGLPAEDLKSGYERTVKALPAAGWKVVRVGKDAAMKQDPECWAEHTADHARLTLELILGKNGATLMARMESPVYVAPPGVDLNTKT